jgi:hypothetical protein
MHRVVIGDSGTTLIRDYDRRAQNGTLNGQSVQIGRVDTNKKFESPAGARKRFGDGGFAGESRTWPPDTPRERERPILPFQYAR